MSQINTGFDNFSPQAIDRSYGALSAGTNIPYASAAAACTAVLSAFRYRGKTVIIDPGTGAQEWWWRTGTADANLVPKILYPQTIDFYVGDGGAYTPPDTTIFYPGGVNPGTLINCKILDFSGDVPFSPLPRTGFQSYQYNPTSGLITLVNTQFAQNTWYHILYMQL